MGILRVARLLFIKPDNIARLLEILPLNLPKNDVVIALHSDFVFE